MHFLYMYNTLHVFVYTQTKISEQQKDDCKRLLTLMGIPYIEVSCV